MGTPLMAICRDFPTAARISPIIRVGEVPGSNPGVPIFPCKSITFHIPICGVLVTGREQKGTSGSEVRDSEKRRPNSRVFEQRSLGVGGFQGRRPAGPSPTALSPRA